MEPMIFPKKIPTNKLGDQWIVENYKFQKSRSVVNKDGSLPLRCSNSRVKDIDCPSTCTILANGALKKPPSPHSRSCKPTDGTKLIFAVAVGNIKKRIVNESLPIKKVMTEEISKMVREEKIVVDDVTAIQIPTFEKMRSSLKRQRFRPD